MIINRDAASKCRREEHIAVIAVHGVADQKPGATARSIVSLLVNGGGAQAGYSEGECSSIVLAVQPLPPMVPVPTVEDDAVRDALLSNDNRSSTVARAEAPALPTIKKSLRQSIRSDFQRPGWTADNNFEHQGAKATAGLRQEGVMEPTPEDLLRADLGIAFSDYLLFKAIRNGAENESYEATRIRTRRHDTSSSCIQHVDVHEMYWADLSRMSGQVPRILGELFTMVFRLSRLGRDAVDQAAQERRARGAPEARSWTRLAAVQIALDWAFSAVLANLFLQLLVVGVAIVALGFIGPAVTLASKALVWTFAMISAWWFCYRHAKDSSSCVTVLLYGITAAWFCSSLPAHWVVGLTLFAALAILCNYGLLIADARFPGTRIAGLIFLALTLLVVVGQVIVDNRDPSRAADLRLWAFSGMRVVEFLLLLIVVWWVVAPVLLVIWLVLGQLAARTDAAARASVATGRLGLFASVASFLTLSMALWALLTTVLELGAANTIYNPIIFPIDGSHDPVTGAVFLQDRYKKSTDAFSLVAGLTLLLVLYLAVVLAPSILAEVKKNVGTSQTLGKWLSAGYRRLDGFVTLIAVTSVGLASGVGLLMLLARFDATPGEWLGSVLERIAGVSRDVLKPLVLSAATAAAALSVFGGVLSRYVPWLRLPLDVALDVDNHFREFPRAAIPRARIFSRYVALLEHIAAQGYDRVVIVAHSQGAVISAELLRYLQHRAKQQSAAGVNDRVTLLWSHLGGRVDLLSAGCPLRQLYAARFPELYSWVLRSSRGHSGPKAADIGVGRWVNVYATGDYVGRWLWCDAPPAVDTWDGKATLYDSSSAATSSAPIECDICLGSGAHTHYFEQGDQRVTSWIDALIAGRPASASLSVVAQ